MDLKEAKSVEIKGKKHLIIPDAEIERLLALKDAYAVEHLAVMNGMFAEGKRRFGENAQFTIGTDPEEEVTNGDEKNH